MSEDIKAYYPISLPSDSQYLPVKNQEIPYEENSLLERLKYIFGRNIRLHIPSETGIKTVYIDRKDAESSIQQYHPRWKKIGKTARLGKIFAEVLASQQNDPKANFDLGIRLLKGDGLQKDEQEARKHIEMAAEKNLRSAQFYLGILYEKGIGGEQNLSKAVSWYEKAAASFHPRAMYKLGCIYEKNGLIEQALSEYRKAAEEGVEEAQDRLGQMYDQGLGVEQNDATAKLWYEKAATSSYFPAQRHLGLFYFEGRKTIPQDYEKAFFWLEKAALQGDKKSQEKLAFLFQEGLGTAKDPAEAAYYRSIAEAKEYDFVQTFFDKMQKELFLYSREDSWEP